MSLALRIIPRLDIEGPQSGEVHAFWGTQSVG